VPSFGVPARTLGEMEELVIDFGDSGTQVFHVGDGSVAVPGLLAGLEEIHGRFASRPWAELVEPAIEVARDGFERDEQRAFLHRILEGTLLRDQGGRRIYGEPGRVQTGDFVATLERIRDVGAAMVAELIPEYADDLRAYRTRPLVPLVLEVLGRTVLSTPSQGGGVVQRILALLAEKGSPTLEDEARAVADAYGAWGEKQNYGRTYMGLIRSTFLIDPEGRIARVWPKVKALGHADAVLRALDELQAAHAS